MVVVAAVVVAVVAAVVVAVVAAARTGGCGDLPGECGERGKAAAAKRALHAGACPNQGCKGGDWLYAEQSPSSPVAHLR